MRCFIEKMRDFFLPILALNKFKISQIIKIFQKFSKFISLMDNIVSKNRIIMKKDQFIVRNMQIATHLCLSKITHLDGFRLLKLIAGFFFYR